MELERWCFKFRSWCLIPAPIARGLGGQCDAHSRFSYVIGRFFFIKKIIWGPYDIFVVHLQNRVLCSIKYIVTNSENNIIMDRCHACMASGHLCIFVCPAAYIRIF